MRCYAGLAKRTRGKAFRSKEWQNTLNVLNYIKSKNPEKNASLSLSESMQAAPHSES
jgi:hypothetical protein